MTETKPETAPSTETIPESEMQKQKKLIKHIGDRD